MPLTLEDLDGQYRVTTVSDYQGPVPMKSDGVTEIRNGRTHRIDDAGVEWTTQLVILNDDEVRLISIANPKNARQDFLLTKESGALTQDALTYTAVLRVARKDNKIRLSGNILHGKISTVITMTKID